MVVEEVKCNMQCRKQLLLKAPGPGEVPQRLFGRGSSLFTAFKIVMQHKVIDVNRLNYSFKSYLKSNS